MRCYPIKVLLCMVIGLWIIIDVIIHNPCRSWVAHFISAPLGYHMFLHLWTSAYAALYEENYSVNIAVINSFSQFEIVI